MYPPSVDQKIAKKKKSNSRKYEITVEQEACQSPLDRKHDCTSCFSSALHIVSFRVKVKMNMSLISMSMHNYIKICTKKIGLRGHTVQKF